jgi:hypothetical protein
LSVRLTTRADANLSDDDLIALAESLLTKRDVPEWSTLGDLIIVTDWQDDLDA